MSIGTIYEILQGLFHLISVSNKVINDNRHVALESTWTNRTHALDSFINMSLMNRRTKDIYVHFLGLYLNPHIKGQMIYNNLPIPSKEYENKMGLGKNLKSHDSLRVSITLHDLVNSFFNKNNEITDTNWLGITMKHNISNLNNMGLAIRNQFSSDKPIYLWSYYEFRNSQSLRWSFAQNLIVIQSNNVYYNPLMKYFEYKEGVETSYRILSYEKHAGRYELCQKVLNEPEFFNSQFLKGFNNGCDNQNINGHKYVDLAKMYQSTHHDNSDLYKLGFRDRFSNVHNDLPFSSFTEYKQGSHDVAKILNKYSK